MYTAKRSLVLNAESGKELPRIPELDALYRRGIRFREGQFIMIAGRSGTQKSGFALWLSAKWNLPTLYFSADMSASTASGRLACMATGDTTDEMQAGMEAGGREAQRYLDAIGKLDINFCFDSPITWRGVEQELEAYIEVRNAYPGLFVFDNLMDFENAESDYAAQTEVMSLITELARESGSTVMVLHHATDKGLQAVADPWRPPPRNEIKNGLAEKPEMILTVALDATSYDYNVACVKQRQGPSNPTGKTYATLRAEPERTRFHKQTPRGV